MILLRNRDLQAGEPSRSLCHRDSHGDKISLPIKRANRDRHAIDAVHCFHPGVFQRSGVVNSGIEVDRSGGSAEDEDQFAIVHCGNSPSFAAADAEKVVGEEEEDDVDGNPEVGVDPVVAAEVVVDGV